MGVGLFAKVIFFVTLSIFLVAFGIYLYNRLFLLMALGFENWKCILNLPSLDQCTQFKNGNCKADGTKSYCQQHKRNKIDLQDTADIMKQSNKN
mgnify:CR=1 FL=1